MDRAARIVAGEIENMTPEDIIRMAREAGFEVNEDGEVLENSHFFQTNKVERFAALVAALVAAAEREACAKILDSVDNYANQMTAADCAAAIRARSKV
jgi:hypothetical protein